MRGVLAVFRLIGLAVAAALFVAWQLSPVPPVLKLIPLGVFALSLARPSAGLLVMAGLGPVLGGWAVSLDSPFGETHAFEQLVLAVLLGSGLRLWRPLPLRLAEPALFLILVAAASAVATQPLLSMQQVPGASVADHVRMLLSGGYFDRGMLGQPLTFAVMTTEALALALVAERLVREQPALGSQLVRMLVVGHAGLALISIDRIVGAALRTDVVLASIVRLVREVRVSTYADLNAAGSVLAMVFMAGCGLLAESSRMRWLTALALAIVGLGLWLTGSRTAFLSLAGVVLGWLLVTAVRRRGRARWIAGGAAAAVVAIGLGTAVLYSPVRNVSASTAISARAFLSKVGIEMWRSAPVLGVGIGAFWAESSKFGGTERPYGLVNENAHNNFIQVLAEQGLVGFGALLIALATVFASARTSAIGPSPLRLSVALGLLVFVLTWFGGHPLLLAEAGFAFWLLAGVLSGLDGPPLPSLWRTLLILGGIVVLATGPIRGSRAIRNADFEYIAVGVSGWRPALDGVRYREAGSTFELYLPGDGSAVTLPLRRAPGAPDPLVVTLRLDGQVVDQVRLTGDGWQPLAIQLPSQHRRFALVGFDVAPAAASPVVLVGKTEPR